MTIPKLIHQLWVGPNPRPKHWMNTWPEKHPDWEYVIWDEDRIRRTNFVNRKHIDFYMKKKIWHGVSDVVMYEMLHKYGGVMVGADSECLRPLDPLFTDDYYDAYCVYENEIAAPGLISPLTACKPGAPFAKALIDGLYAKEEVGEPWKTTGNQHMKDTLALQEWPTVKVWPSHYFNPVHYSGLRYDGPDKSYGMQWWGTTKKRY